MKKYIVRLTKEEREELKAIGKKGKVEAYKIRHANLLLSVDVDGPNRTDEETAEIFWCNLKTLENLRRRFVEEGMESALGRKKQEKPSRAKKLDGEKEARLIAMSCSKPPEGRDRWTLKMLANNMIVLEIVDTVSTETIRKTLKKTN